MNILLSAFLRSNLDEFFSHPLIVEHINTLIASRVANSTVTIGADASVLTKGKVDSGLLGDDVTRLGNTFNTANQLVRLASNGKLPRLDGSLLFNLIGSNNTGTVRLPTDVTSQGNSFNGANQLLKLGTNSELPAVDGAALLNILKNALSGVSMDNNGNVILGGSALQADAEIPFNGNKVMFTNDGTADYIYLKPDGIECLWSGVPNPDSPDDPVDRTSFNISATEFYYSKRLADGQGTSIQINETVAVFNSNDAAGNKVKVQLDNSGEKPAIVFSFVDAAGITTTGGSVKDGVLRLGTAAGNESSDFNGIQFGLDGKVKVTGTVTNNIADSETVLGRDAQGNLCELPLTSLIDKIRAAL